MSAPSLNSALVKIGVSKSYASQIVAGHRSPSLPLALRIYRSIGVKLGPIKGATESEISSVEKMERRRTTA